MDFVELEAIEGLRWSWNSWPSSKSASESLPIPLSVMCTPLMHHPELPILPYDPVSCSACSAVLNPYARVRYDARIWFCPFCDSRNRFPPTFVVPLPDGTALPAELYPTYSVVEYVSPSPPPGVGAVAFVFVVDLCFPAEEELRAVKGELLRVVELLPENVLVGLVTFDSMVRVHDLGFGECSRIVLLHGDREVSSDQTQKFLGLKQSKHNRQQLNAVQYQGFLMPISDCEFNITTAIEEIHCSVEPPRGHRPPRCTGAAISAAVSLLEGSLVTTGSRVIVFTTGPATRGPGMVVDSDLSCPIRTHRDLINGCAPHYRSSLDFYRRISERLSGSSIVLDLFACSLDQVGAAEMKQPIERSGGVMMLGESFDSDQFRDCLRRIFARNPDNDLQMCLDATIQVITTRDIKIRGTIGPCASLRMKNDQVVDDGEDEEIGEGGTHTWKLGTVADKTCLAFFFRAEEAQPGSAFFLQFVTRYRAGSGFGGYRKRVATVSRRRVAAGRFASGFDQEAAAAVVARAAVQRAETHHARDVIRWLDDSLIQFAREFGDYVPEDPETFQLSPNLSLYPQFMYHLRRSQFIDVFNHTPDETARDRVALTREPVSGSVTMIQPALFEYSFDGPPVPVLLDVRSISPETILLLDSYFRVVIHYGSRVAQWRKLRYDKDPAQENFRKLLEAPEVDAEQLASERVPRPVVVKCDQHSSQARFLLAKLNPSVTHNSTYKDGSDVILTDDLSLQVFLDHLQVLGVQG